MDILHLKYFAAVADTLNFTRAAARLYVSRQAVSQAVKQLETELNVKLLLNDNGHLSLTPAGDRIYAETREFLGEFDQFSLRIQGYRDASSSTLRILTGAAVMTNYPTDLILRFNSLHPDLMLSITEADNQEMRAMLDAQKADISIMGTASRYLRNYRYTLLKKQALTVLVNKDNPLASRDFLTIEDLRGQPMIGHGEAYDLHRFYVDSCRNAGFEPSFSMISTNIDLILLLLQQNRSLSFGTQDPASVRKISLDYCMSIPFVSSDSGINWGIYAVTSKDHPLREAQKLFIRFLSEE